METTKYQPVELTAKLTRDLAVSREIAEAAAGALLRLASARAIWRDDGEFSLRRLADAVPGFSDLVSKSPDFDPHATGGIQGWLGSRLNALWGTHRLHERFGGALYPLGDAFASLGLDRPMVARFAMALLQWFRATSGAETATFVEQLLADSAEILSKDGSDARRGDASRPSA